MAYKDSGEIATNSNYALGDYSFRIERTSVPGSTNDKIEAICTDKDGKNARKSIQVPSSTQLLGWYVEANETTADVYVMTHNGGIAPGESIVVGDKTLIAPIVGGGIADGIKWLVTGGLETTVQNVVGSIFATEISDSDGHSWFIFATEDSNASFKRSNRYGGDTLQLRSSYTYNNSTVYYAGQDNGTNGYITQPFVSSATQNQAISRITGEVAWAMLYSGSGPEPEGDKTILVGRFGINLEDAGGVGPGSDWTDPGDYDEDWEEGDPTYTLYVEVTGALSGRHNDPIEDPSYSYIPADKDTVKDYGCGGDGGHGGGGGAGASTVVVHKFATNQANSKEVTAIARRHGYGSGGGKGGKGGDGCILVYY